MALIGINIDKRNPEYTINDFKFWMRQFKDVEDLETLFDNLYPIANNKIFYSIFGSDWKLAMSLCIAHYATLISNTEQLPAAKSLANIAGGGTTRGVLASATIGGFSKTYDLDRSMISGDEFIWWNSTSFGAQLIALMKTKGIPSILVVTSNPVPGAM